jgi:hypothetical protein
MKSGLRNPVKYRERYTIGLRHGNIVLRSRREGTPKRTREHRIADLSAHHVEGFILRQGHIVEAPRHDYGYDFILYTFDYRNGEDGEFEPNCVKIQLKATDNLRVLADGQTISFAGIERDHINLWRQEAMPVILIVFDAQREIAYWLHVQPYLNSDLFRMTADQDTVTVRIPMANVVTQAAIENFRQLKNEWLLRIATARNELL